MAPLRPRELTRMAEAYPRILSSHSGPSLWETAGCRVVLFGFVYLDPATKVAANGHKCRWVISATRAEHTITGKGWRRSSPPSNPRGRSIGTGMGTIWFKLVLDPMGEGEKV